MEIVKDIILDLSLEKDKNSAPKYIVVHQGEKNSRVLRVKITNNRKRFNIPERYIAHVDACVNNKIVANDVECKINPDGNDESIVCIPITEYMCAETGVGKLNLKFVEDEAVVIAQDICIVIKESVVEASENIYSDIDRVNQVLSTTIKGETEKTVLDRDKLEQVPKAMNDIKEALKEVGVDVPDPLYLDDISDLMSGMSRVVLDTELDENSTNGVENQAVAKKVNTLLGIPPLSGNNNESFKSWSLFQTTRLSEAANPFVLAYQDSVTSTPSNIKIPLDAIAEWILKDQPKLTKEMTSAVANEYGKLLTNVKDPALFMANSGYWTDVPNKETVIFINLQYSTNYNVQIAISVVNSGVIYTRVVNRNTLKVFKDWGTASEVTVTPEFEPMKVLAVGDSLCSGSRNSNKGFVGDLGLEYRNAGLGMATISNYRTTVTNIPNQLIGVTDFTPDIIIANGGVNDYYYHVPLGEVSTTPVTTDEQAEALDRDTVMGGLEYLFYKMIKLHPKAQRFFLITHKTYAAALHGGTGKAYWVTYKNNAGYTQQDMHDAFVKCCKTYNVKVIDVYEESLINTLYPEYVSDKSYSIDNSVNDTEYVDTDGIHPLAYGYLQGYVPIIKKAIGIGTAKV